MRQALFFIGRWTTNIALVCLAVGASVRPEEAMSNISGWAAKFNLPDPAWLQSHTADSVIFWVAVSGVVALSAGPIIWRKFSPQASQTISATAPSKPDSRAPANKVPKSQDQDDKSKGPSATEMQFLRWRWVYAIFSGPPFFSYRAKRRLEFVDSWARYFNERKTAKAAVLGDGMRADAAINAPFVTEWLHPSEAFERFGDPALLEKIKKIDNEISAFNDHMDELQAELHNLSDARNHPNTLNPEKCAKRQAEILNEVEVISTKYKDANTRKGVLASFNREYLRFQLIEKMLIAKGCRLVNGAAQREYPIPSYQWKFLQLGSYDSDEAEGKDWSYIGVEIARPTKSA